MATKKSGGSSRNGRDSAGRRLGIKKNHHNYVKTGQILIRQRGLQILAGHGVGIGKDHTLYSLCNGYVIFQTTTTQKGIKKMVEVLPCLM
uniref:Ribosomal protein L27 n=1 Tax=Jakoba bahamiensis TaxID=221721 RepID=M4QC16_9EUKA|nr:ribosomal protein L27 [Jakoba bahamiensis]AGH24124.1 ribosomal protein L27 [Jakoba bahamiensis]